MCTGVSEHALIRVVLVKVHMFLNATMGDIETSKSHFYLELTPAKLEVTRKKQGLFVHDGITEPATKDFYSVTQRPCS